MGGPVSRFVAALCVALTGAMAVAGCRSAPEAPASGAPATEAPRPGARPAAPTGPALPPRFERLTAADGLASSYVVTLHSDRRGFLWVGTSDGLQRYDGARFVAYPHDPTAPGALGSHFVHGTTSEDPAGRLWLSTDDGVDRFDPATERYTHYRQLPADPAHLPRGIVTSTAVGADGDLWVGVWRHGLWRLDPEAGTARSVPVPAGHPHAEAHATVYKLLRAPDGTVWAGTSGGLDRIDPRTGRREHVDLGTGGDGRPFRGAYSLLLDRQGRLWVGTRHDGLRRYDPATGTVRAYPVGPGGMGHPWVLSLAEEPDGTVWAGTDGGGLHRYDPVRDAFDRFVHDPGDPTSLTDNRILCLHVDRQGVLWVATSTGLNRRLPLSRVFAHERHRAGDPRSLGSNDVTAFTEDTSGALWVGTDGGGLYRRDPATGALDPVPLDPGAPAGGPADAVLALAADADGAVWVGTYEDLFRVDAATRRSEPVLVDAGDGVPRSLAAPAALAAAGGWLWAGPQDGVYRIHPRTRRATFFARGGAEGLSDALVQTLVAAPDGRRAWVGLGPHLDRLDTMRAVSLRAPGGAGVPARGDVLALYRAPDGALWAGTRDGAERRVGDRLTARLGAADGLPSAVVNGLFGDGDGGVWAATNRGITRLTGPAPGAPHLRFDTRDGMASDVASVGAVYQSPRTGIVYVGSDNGYTAFHPDALVPEEPPPPVVLTGLRLFNEPVPVGADGSPLTRAIGATDRLRLGPRDAVVTVTFAALDFRAPAQHRYAVRLDGLHDDWLDVGDQREVTFTGLRPGRYTLRVRAAGRDGVWGAPSAPLALTVAPPWWRTWWAWLAYLGLAVAAGGALARDRRARRAARDHLAAEHREAEKLRALDRAKSQFFANVSHEFRTPLTLTLGPLDDVLAGAHGDVAPGVAGQLALARRNASRVLDLINQILDVARLEAGRTPLRASRLDLGGLVRQQAEAFAALATLRRLTFTVDVPDAPLDIYANAEQIGTILANLLSNAFKFTPEGGAVRVTVGADDDAARVTVRDTGPGIPAADVPHVFDRFHQVGDGTATRPLGTGIGLALARELAELHGGRLSVESQEGFGSVFTLTLRQGRAHLTDEQVVDAPAAGPAGAGPDLADIPASEGLPIGADEPEADERAGDVTTVLIVDDHPDLRAYLVRHLRAAGYRVHVAADGAEGLALARECLPDLVVSDVMMPVLDGLGLCRALKGDPETDFIPVVLLTAKAEAEDRLDGLREHCDDYLTKPFDPPELLARIANLIASRRRLRARFAVPDRPAVAPVPPSGAGAVAPADRLFLDRVHAAIEAHLGDDTFSVERLAEATGASRSHLHRHLRALTGQAPSDLLRTARLARAAHLLATRTGTVSEVAYAVGFKSVGHFSDSFTAAYGCRPSGYVASAPAAEDVSA